MKYVITDQNEARVGGGYHSDLAEGLKGKVVSAGQCIKREDGRYEVFGESYGYGIRSKPEDAETLDSFFNELLK